MATAVLSAPSMPRQQQNPPRRRKQDSFGSTPANRAAVGEFRDGLFVAPETAPAQATATTPKKSNHQKAKSRSTPTMTAVVREGGSSAATPSKPQTSRTSTSPPKTPANHYAGGAYANSPDPSALPMPSFGGPRKVSVASTPAPFVATPAANNASMLEASNSLRKLLNIPQPVSAQ